MEVNSDLKDKYDEFYSENTEKWRKLGAVGKVNNVVDLTDGLEIETLIEVGAGDGNLLSIFAEKNFCEKLAAVEISSSGIEQIKNKNIKGLFEVKQFNGYELPYEDNSFDLAVCSHVIEHVEHPRILLREIKRISKFQVFEIPIDFSFNVDKKFNHFNSYGHINIFTPALFNFLLLSEGFEIVKKKYSLYGKEILKFQHKNYSIKYIKILLKRSILRMFPFIMKIKPNTYTVLTK